MIGQAVGSRGRGVRACALGTSAVALAMVLGGTAHAQCAPDPTQVSGTTNCTGTDGDGLTVATSDTRVIVAPDAVVRPGAALAAITSRASNVSLTVNGLVDGGTAKPGIFVTNGTPVTVPCDPYAGASVSYCVPGSLQTGYASSSASITVGAGGQVTGGQGILIRRDPANTSGFVGASLINAGTISGTAGPAVVADQTGAAPLSVSNAATGTIGGIAGQVSSLTNAGTIDGGVNAALASTTGAFVTNSGRIVSTGSAATLSAAAYLSVTNDAGATIGGSSTAIRTTGALYLFNAGTINGSVVSTAGAGQASTVDTRTGTINGDLILGAGNDTLRARYDAASGQMSSVTGTVNGGAGTDTLAIAIDADTTLGSAVLPTGFDLLGLDFTNNATATLAPGFASGTGMSVAGNGTLINQAALVTSGPAVNGGFISGVSLINQGSITATLTSGQAAVNGLSSLTNTGTITGTGGAGARASTLINSNAIIATGTAAEVGTFTNNGTIRSTEGVGADVYGSGSSTTSTNTGTITGATTGLVLSYGRLENSGGITGGTTAVSLGGTLVNAASGSITGGSAGAIAGNGSTARIINAGNITGTVDLTSPYSFDSTNDLFVDDGGTVNGAIRLGGGDDQLVVTLGSDTARPLAGASGGVDAGAGYDTLRYRVNADASTSLSLVSGFEGLAYELNNGAALILTGTTPFTTTVGLAGNGSVTLDGDIATTDRTLVDATVPTMDQLTASTAGPERALAITNAGNLTLTTTQTYGYTYIAAIDAGAANITNTGTITVNNAAGNYYPAAAIQGGTVVTNTGTISLTGGGTAIRNAQDVTNSGTVTDAAGANASGISGFATLTNSGTIQVDDTAVQGGYGFNTGITNSGMIESRRGTAVSLGYYASLVNEATGTISGVTAVNLADGGSAVVNRGAIIGDVSASTYSYNGSTYVADGGTLAGNLTFGSGNDMLVAFTGDARISGTVDGGAGTDTLVHARRATDTVTVGTPALTGFEQQSVRALGTDTVVTVRADAPIMGDLLLSGDGAIVNTATITGAVRTDDYPYYNFYNDPTLTGTNGLTGFTNRGTIGTDTLATSAVVYMSQASALSFANDGTITNDGSVEAVTLYGLADITIANSGTITGGGLLGSTYGYTYDPVTFEPVALASRVAMTNTGTVTAAGGPIGSGAVLLDAGFGLDATVMLDNTGTIQANEPGTTGVLLNANGGVSASTPGAVSLTLNNTGTIRANGGGLRPALANPGAGATITYPASAVIALDYSGRTASITNAAGATIEATGTQSIALGVLGAALDLSNAGTIRGGAGTALAANDPLVGIIGSRQLAGAIQTVGFANDRIVNTGSIIGSVDLGVGDDRIENRGRIEGNVFLGAGDDGFLHAAAATLLGTVDGGAGTDGLVIDATGGGAVNGDQFVNFEILSQIGQGSVAYSGDFRVATIGLSGGTVTVAAGQTLATTGAFTLTGSEGMEMLDNAGTVSGAVALGAGNDLVFNHGTIGGSVLLGDDDDVFVEGAGSRVAGVLDGGEGNDLYTVLLAGNHDGLGQRTGFERLVVEGSGTLSLTLDQRFDSVGLAGTGLNLSLGGYTVGQVTGSDGNEVLAVDGDLAQVALGAGNDQLSLGTTRAAGTYAGGAGTDVLRFTAATPVTLAGSATGFEQLVLAGGALTVTGTLGSAGAPLSLGDGAQQLAVANGGTLAGVIDLGAGNDGFRLAAGGTLAGTVSGGAGSDTATVELAGDRTLAAIFSDVETLATEGTGTLTLAGTQVYDRVASATNLTVGTDGTLTAVQVQFGAGNNRFLINGRFAGAVDGGTGTDTIAVAGGSAAAPVAFTTIATVEGYTQTGGYATIAGTAALGSVDMSGGRLVGFAGSTITAAQIAVRQGATFGSAGTVTGNIAVAGTLSPGASPGTMTVNGNVSLAAGSVSLFELTPTVSDRLVVNGAVQIAPGATLQLVPEGTLRPGTSYDLVVASGGITGSYSTVVKPDTLFGFLVQRADRIQLIGQFLVNAAFSPQVSRSIAYANATLAVQPATSPLFAALPSLLTTGGASNPRAFAQLTPEAYASATQVGVDNALTLTGVARGPAFSTTRDEVGLFTFGQAVSQWHTLGADAAEGTAKARTRGYGLLGGLGVGDASWSVGAFGGYINTRQGIEALGAGTESDGFVAGVHGRYTQGAFGVTASVLYNGGDARTDRALPGATSARGRYDLNNWVSDLSVSYGLDMGDWTLRPKAGITYLRTTRDGLTEAGGPFALTVARERHVAGFADGGVTLGRSDASEAAFRPFVGLGLRYQIEGRRTDALASYAGGPLGLEALGASRARTVGTASAGIAYRFSNGLDLFSTASAQTGRDDHQETISTGVRLRF